MQSIKCSTIASHQSHDQLCTPVLGHRQESLRHELSLHAAGLPTQQQVSLCKRCLGTHLERPQAPISCALLAAMSLFPRCTMTLSAPGVRQPTHIPFCDAFPVVISAS